MILQSVIFPNELCDVEKLYLRTNGGLRYEGDTLFMSADAEVSTYTYMNMFDIGVWTKYTTISDWQASIFAKGRFEAELLHTDDIYYLKVKAVTDVTIYKICFESVDEGDKEADTKEYPAGTYYMHLSPQKIA